jgi:hypothetical protein
MRDEDRRIRPSIEFLRSRTELKVMTNEDLERQLLCNGWTPEIVAGLGIVGADFQLELKLVTRDAEYWLCTQGEEPPGSRFRKHGVIGYVTKMPLSRGGDGCWESYGPEEEGLLQDLDYRDLLKEQVDVLYERWEKDPSDENLELLEAARKELDAVDGSLREQRRRP